MSKWDEFVVIVAVSISYREITLAIKTILSAFGYNP